MPYVFAAVRMSFAVAWKVEALTEVFGGTNGVGFQIRNEYQLFNITGVIAWMALFIVFTHRSNLQRMREGVENRARRLWILRPR